MVSLALSHGRIESDEHKKLLAYFGAFHFDGKGFSSITQNVDTGEMLYSTCPEITFPERSFCITGASNRATRRRMREYVESMGGISKEDVSKHLNYLVVCDGGNPTWSYSCYGRKLELAISYRREGASLVVVRENDFWDGLADNGIEIRVPKEGERLNFQ
jgi:hypothetical protein